MRLQAGLREPAYEASVRRMLAGGLAGEVEVEVEDSVSVSPQGVSTEGLSIDKSVTRTEKVTRWQRRRRARVVQVEVVVHRRIRRRNQ